MRAALNRISSLHLAATLLCRRQKDTYDAVMDIVKTHYGAYGIAVEYVHTMVHNAPPTVFPEYVAPSAAKPARRPPSEDCS